MSELAKIKANLSNLIRGERKDGVDYLVAPVVMITEGVHNNIMYPAEELQKFPAAWNGRPLPLYHPTLNGQAVTANSPEMIAKHSIGQVFNVRYEQATDRNPARLTGEAWIDTGKLKKLSEADNPHAKALSEMLDNDEPIEVSTGLFTDDGLKNGKWNGEEFIAIARNHRPDHLAILPKGKGACSNADGCGLPRINEQDEGGMTISKAVEHIRNLISRLANNRPTTNELTARDKRAALDTALRQKLGLTPSQFVTVEDMGMDFVVYTIFNERTGKEVLKKRGYSIDGNDQITLADADEMVTKRTEYIAQQPQVPQMPRANADQKTPTKGTDPMDEKIDKLIANEKSSFTADDKVALLKLNEAVIDGMLAEAEGTEVKANEDCACKGKETAATPAVIVNNEEAEKTVTKGEIASVVTEAFKGLNLNELIAAEVAKAREADQRTPVLERLKANAACKIDDSVLDTMDAQALTQLEQSITPASFAGLGSVRTNGAENPFSAPDMPPLFEVKQ